MSGFTFDANLGQPVCKRQAPDHPPGPDGLTVAANSPLITLVLCCFADRTVMYCDAHAALCCLYVVNRAARGGAVLLILY